MIQRIVATSLAAMLVMAGPSIAAVPDAGWAGPRVGPMTDLAPLLVAQQNQNRAGAGGPQLEQEQNQGTTQNEEQNRNRNQGGNDDDSDDDEDGNDDVAPILTREEATKLPAYACFYADPQMQGDVLCAPDSVRVMDLDDHWDDRISSIEIVGTSIKVCTEESLMGTCADFDASVPTLPADLDDKITSFSVGD